MPKLVTTGFAVAFVAGLLVTACGSDAASTTSSSTVTTNASALTGAITVSAASSLAEAFTAIGAGFRKVHPAARAAFNFGSSSTLATQIEQGAPADGFASADDASMDALVRTGLVVGQPTVFARNRLVIVTKPGNPRAVKHLTDLADLGVVSLCGSEVPCGKYAKRILTAAGVAIPADKITRGRDVKATLGAVTTGDADAAIVYATDARTAGNAIDAVPIPDRQNAIASYPISALAASTNGPTARAFVDYVTGPKGQATLRSFGFLPPT